MSPHFPCLCARYSDKCYGEKDTCFFHEISFFCPFDSPCCSIPPLKINGNRSSAATPRAAVGIRGTAWHPQLILSSAEAAGSWGYSVPRPRGDEPGNYPQKSRKKPLSQGSDGASGIWRSRPPRYRELVTGKTHGLDCTPSRACRKNVDIPLVVRLKLSYFRIIFVYMNTIESHAGTTLACQSRRSIETRLVSRPTSSPRIGWPNASPPHPGETGK